MQKLIVAICLIALLSVLACGLMGCNGNEKPNADFFVDFVKTDGRAIIGADGNRTALVGTNLGGWLVQEEWMCPTDVGGYEFCQLEMMITLANRFGKKKMEQLIKVYEDNWITEKDFANIAKTGLNTVRIPFTYFNLCDTLVLDEQTGEYVLKPFEQLTLRENAFDRLDWAIEMCQKYGLYAIPDMHGAVGSQSGQHHSGDTRVAGGRLWEDGDIGEICREKTKWLWLKIANRYKDNKAVAGYDLLNEPGVTIDGEQVTTSTNWDYYDELYDAIREVDPNHTIILEGCWDVGSLPAPSKYGWENVIYEYHFYNRDTAANKQSSFYSAKLVLDYLAKIEAPTLIGEFAVWGDGKLNDEEAWRGVIQFFCGKGWNFLTWSLKGNSVASTWFMYLMNGDLDAAQVNFKTDSFDDIKRIWASHNSANYRPNDWLIDSITDYIDDFNTNGYDNRPLNEQLESYAILQ